MIFAEEKLKDILHEVVPMWHQHWMETEMYHHDQPFNPDVKRFLHYNEIGFYHLFTARSDTGELAGNAGMYVSTSMHTQKKTASEDTMFLLPAYRKGWNCIKFYRYIENSLREMGVVEIMQDSKLMNGVGRVLEFCGYKHVASRYSKGI